MAVSLNPRVWLAAGANRVGLGALNMPVSTAVKGFGLAALIAGAAGGLIAYDAVAERGKKHKDHDVPVEPLPPLLLTPQDLMMQPMPMADVGPADGYGPNQWRNMVNASRGQAPEVAAAAQPRMSAIDPDSVRDLGAAKTTQAV